jgi:hypothetical protein
MLQNLRLELILPLFLVNDGKSAAFVLQNSNGVMDRHRMTDRPSIPNLLRSQMGYILPRHGGSAQNPSWQSGHPGRAPVWAEWLSRQNSHLSRVAIKAELLFGQSGRPGRASIWAEGPSRQSSHLGRACLAIVVFTVGSSLFWLRVMCLQDSVDHQATKDLHAKNSSKSITNHPLSPDTNGVYNDENSVKFVPHIAIGETLWSLIYNI